MSSATAGQGTTISWAGTSVAEVTKIGDVELSAKAIDVTHLGSTAKEYISGLVEAGSVKIEGNFYAGDTNGQIALKAAIGGASGAVVITFPTATGASWSFTAIVTKFTQGKSEGKDCVPFSAEFQITGLPTMSISTSTGLTTAFFALNNSAVVAPTASGSVYDYVATVLTAVSSVTVTPTATAGVITVNGSVVSTGVASSAIALGSAGSITTVTIVVTETGKMPKTYTIRVVRGV